MFLQTVLKKKKEKKIKSEIKVCRKENDTINHVLQFECGNQIHGPFNLHGYCN